MARRVLIMGAAGKDFHVFNTTYRGNPEVRVVAFTAAQIPNIDDRRYPPELAGPEYPDGIPIEPEEELADIIQKQKVDEVIFAYSDVSFNHIAEREKTAINAGAKFRTFDIEPTLLPTGVPLIAVCAVRTGAGKSPAARLISRILREKGRKVVVIRHPMPYGDLVAQRVQRFATVEDLEKHDCTIEEMEEYEPHIKNGFVVYAGVDYADILAEAEKEAEVILWDGGNNDTPHYRAKLHITIADSLRPGDELKYFPSITNVQLADVVIVNKVNQARQEDIETVINNCREINPKAVIVRANSVVSCDNPDLLKGKRVLVVEDGPTLTHGGMKYGAGVVAARRAGAAELVDPRPFLVGSLKDTFEKYPGIGTLLPAVGYGDEQVHDLEATINATDCDAVVVGTPINLNRIIKIEKPSVRVTYEIEEIDAPDLEELLVDF
ncbi:MAG: GTPase [Planctomycetota bacterium]|nr:MAG: GTPase [Planctomycetota bacterium]